MTITLVYRGETSVPVEVEGLTPEWVAGKTLAEVERFEVFHGNRKIPLAELFSVSGNSSGDASDLQLEFCGDLSGVHWIGARMTVGTVRVQGNAGWHLGSQMRGGEIIVDGSAGDWLGAEMHKGLIRVNGNAGNLTGAAYRGSQKGMTGGMILVDGDAGNEIGHSMRRGLIAIGGSAGAMLGYNMIAGTIAVFGSCGVRPGAGMRRGTLALLGQKTPQLLPTFRYSTTYRAPGMALMLKILRDRGFRYDEALLKTEYSLYHGDLVGTGLGEILIPGQECSLVS